MTKQPQTGLIGRFYRQVENRPKNTKKLLFAASRTYALKEKYASLQTFQF